MLFNLIIGMAMASSSITTDNYVGSVPPKFEQDSIIFTTPALQGMERANISKETVLDLIKSNPGKDQITENNLNLFLTCNRENSSTRRLVSFWKEI